MDFLLSALPLFILFSLVVIFRRSVVTAAMISLVAIILVGLFYWEIAGLRLASAGIKGVFLATEIILIIFGALLIFESLRFKGFLATLKTFFELISFDRRVHIILIGWALVHFIEGVAGFGTPALVAVPLFLTLGFAPVLSVVLALIGDSVPVIFGAIGLPVTYGIGTTAMVLDPSGGMLRNISELIASFNILGSLIIPLLLIFIYIKYTKRPLKQFWDFIPFALVSGLAVSIPAFLVNKLLGPELPSIIGGLIGLFIIAFMAKQGFLLPADTVLQSDEEKEGLPEVKDVPEISRRAILLALSPYFFLVAILALTRLPFLPIKNFLLELTSFQVENLFGYAIDYSFYPFYSAGFLIIITALFSFLILGVRGNEIRETLSFALNKTARPFLALVLILFFVQIFIYSDENLTGLAAMPFVLAEGIASVFGKIWPLLAPAIGAFGAFVAGSATVSNLLLSELQLNTALAAGFNPSLILALQGVGAAAGNMIAMHNVIAALAIVGLVSREHEVIHRNLLPLLIYLLIFGVLGLILAFLL